MKKKLSFFIPTILCFPETDRVHLLEKEEKDLNDQKNSKMSASPLKSKGVTRLSRSEETGICFDHTGVSNTRTDDHHPDTSGVRWKGVVKWWVDDTTQLCHWRVNTDWTRCERGHRVVYYESINRELKRRPIYECRCDERLKTSVMGECVI